MRNHNPTPWWFQSSLQAVLWAVFALCVGNAFGSLTLDPLDLPRADSADTAKIRQVAEVQSAQILALEEIGDSAEGCLGRELLTKDPMDQFWNPYSYVGGDPLTGADPWGLYETPGVETGPGVITGGEVDVISTSDSRFDLSLYTLPSFPVGGLRPSPAKVIDVLKPGGLMNLSSEGTKTAVRAGLYLGGPKGIAVNALWHAAEGDSKSAAMDVAFLGAYGVLRTGLALRAGSAAAAPAFSATEVLGNPNGIWGMSAEAIAADFNTAGFQAEIVQSTRSSGLARIIRVKGHPVITQIQMHPGGGRHAGAYYKISTSTQGIIKVVDPLTYVPAAGEKASIINAH